ncbi:MAG: haloacid dehalogenase-like hydrolase [Planctomycetes bacterium]|nr:haloacid dehalogenase-like hydrolase [Planctomycetota bacterium]
MMRTVLLLVTACILFAGEPLPSWRQGPVRDAIVEFVAAVTTPGGPAFVPPAERIAVFDNDGTLWAEQPGYVQLFFIVDRIKALAPRHPEWRTQEPFASILRGDLAAAMAGGERALLEMAMATHAGMTTDEFAALVSDWMATARHPTTGRPFTGMVYQPMLELLAWMRANGFRTWIVSGGGVEFIRPWSEKVYGVPPEQVIGSSIATVFAMQDGVPVLRREARLDFIDDKEGKPVGIQRHIGRRPIAAFGNSDGDLQMLQWTAAGPGRRLCALVHHTDAAREWAYDRTSPIGRLDKAQDEAQARGWTVVDMARDWAEVHPPQDRAARAGVPPSCCAASGRAAFLTP